MRILQPTSGTLKTGVWLEPKKDKLYGELSLGPTSWNRRSKSVSNTTMVLVEPCEPQPPVLPWRTQLWWWGPKAWKEVLQEACTLGNSSASHCQVGVWLWPPVWGCAASMQDTIILYVSYGLHASLFWVLLVILLESQIYLTVIKLDDCYV